MKVTNVERIIVDVPFTPRQQEITRQSVYNWSILELCKVATDTGHVGWGETVIHYTYGRVTDDAVARTIGQSPADLMNEDSLGAGLQMALVRRGRQDTRSAGASAAGHQSARLDADLLVVQSLLTGKLGCGSSRGRDARVHESQEQTAALERHCRAG